MSDKKPSFEKDLERLEEIVGALEEGGLPLDESLKRFEEGIGLVRRCEKALSEAEKRIEILVKNAQGEVEAKPFGEESGVANAPAAPQIPPAPRLSGQVESAPEGDDDSSDEGLLF